MLFWIIVIMANCEDKCFVELFLKALSIKRNFKLYDSEKKHARSGTEDIHKCDCSKFSKGNYSGRHSPNTGMKRLSFFERFLDEDSLRNFILKSVFGFIGGILLTYIFFIFLVFSLNFTLKKATYICMVLGVILSLGLAFSVRIRCTVFLCIPQLFSKRGRQVLLAYAFILALSGPAKNTLHNVEVMSESLACKQQQLRQVENEVLKCVQKPNAAAKKSIEKLLEKINSASKYFKNFILQFYRTCYDILEAILHSQKWLYSITALCHKKIGRPAKRCLYFLQEASENCQGIYSMRDWKKDCQIKAFSQQLICSSSARSFCERRDVPQKLAVDQLQKQLSTFKRRAMNILYVRLEAQQIYSQSNQSNVHYEEVQGVATEIREKTDQFLQYFDFMSLIFGIFILVLFMKVMIYRYRFLTDDNYDNRYITHDFVDIDKTRAEFKMETLLPLEPREKAKYIKVTSVRLVPCEKVRLLSSFIFLLFASFKIIVHMLTDSSLYWILSTIRREEKLFYMSCLREEDPSVAVRVVGDGLVADFVRNMTKVVKRPPPRLDPTPCLPDPIPPDWNRYYQILALVLICWLLAICEPYGLRLRHTIMVSYHPDRARERAIWLYNQIISDRSRFVKLARRNIRKRYKYVSQGDTLRFHFFLRKSAPKCLLCKITLYKDFDQVKCATVRCPGLFCVRCYDSLKFCSICNDPAEYGDLSDISEEKDSSEEENPRECCKKRKTIEKPLQTTDNTKENLKKPSFSICSGCSKKREDTMDLIRPKILLNDFGFPKNKNRPKTQKSLSDLESSDWETSNSFKTLKKKVKIKISSGKGDEGMRKGTQPHKMGNYERNLQENSKQKVCLFEKVSECGQRAEPCRPEKRETGDNSQSDCLSKEANEGSQGGSDSGEGRCFLKAKDSIKMLKKQPNRSPECLNKELSETGLVLAKDESYSWSSEEDQPTSMNVKYYEIKKKRYPFIDPINIHEISHKWSEWQLEIDLEDSGNCQQLERESSGSSRIRLVLPEDTDSIQENLQLTITEQMTTSTPDNDCQFYSQPRKPSAHKIKLRKKKSWLKRTSGKLNLKAQKVSTFYSIETDSSNEKFLSVKLLRRVRKRRKKKPETLQMESKEIRKIVSGYLKRAKSEKVDLTKGKDARLFEKEKADGNTPGDDGSSDTDDDECVPETAIFLSDEEFEKISRTLNETLARNKKKKKTLNKAPDFASCKRKSSKSLSCG